MTVTGSSRRVVLAVGAAAAAVVLATGTSQMYAGEPALTMRATVVGSVAAPPLTIELLRWTTDSERTPLLAAMSPPPPAPAAPAETAAAPAGGRAAGRGGRGGRGGAAPVSPAARLSAAIAAAPTVGFIWGDGPTGYSIKYAWRSPAAGGQERIVLATERRVGAHATSWPASPGAAADAEFTVIEIRIDSKGAGQGKASPWAGVVVDAAAKTLALDGYATAPVLLEVTR